MKVIAACTGTLEVARAEEEAAGLVEAGARRRRPWVPGSSTSAQGYGRGCRWPEQIASKSRHVGSTRDVGEQDQGGPRFVGRGDPQPVEENRRARWQIRKLRPSSRTILPSTQRRRPTAR